MRRALVTVAMTAACASTPTFHTPVDPSALRPGEGRVAVTVRSSGATQHVAPVPEGTAATQGMDVTPWCDTPCTLHLAPGPWTLWAGAPSVRDSVSALRVAERPLAVVLHAPERRRWERGRNLVVGGAGLAALGVIFVGFSPLEITGGSPTGPETVAVGLGLGAIGGALLWWGLREMRAEPAGAASIDVTPPRAE